MRIPHLAKNERDVGPTRAFVREPGLEAAIEFWIPGELDGGAGVGLPSRFVERNQPLLVLHVGFQLNVRCEALNHIEAEIGLRGAAGDKVLIGFVATVGKLQPFTG